MKIIYIIAFAFIAITTSAFSQTDQGKLIIGGSSNLGLNFRTSETEINGNNNGSEQKTTSFNISPNIGYFIIDNLAVGISLPFNTGSSKFDDGKSTFSSFVVSPFVRYYFTQSNIKPYILGRVGFGSSKSSFRSSFSDNDSKSNVFNFGFGGGVAIFVNDFVSFNLGINYGNSTSKPNNDSVADIKTTNSNLGFGAGISIVL